MTRSERRGLGALIPPEREPSAADTTMLLPAVSVGAAVPPSQAPGQAPGADQQHSGPTTIGPRLTAQRAGGLVEVDGSVLASAAAVLADVAAGRNTPNVQRLAGTLSDVLHAAAGTR